jgi:hypothetical protein
MGRSLRRPVRASGVGMADQAAAERQEGPESRVLAAGYVPCAGMGWLTPDGVRVVRLEQAVAEIEGERP